MTSSVGAPTVVIGLDEFEEHFLPVLPTPPSRTQDLATGIVSHLQTLLSRDEKSRLDSKEELGTILLAAINNYNLAEGHRGRGYHYGREARSSEDDASIAMLYPKEHTPSIRTEGEDWSRVQMLIQFDSGGARYDPYDEIEGMHTGSSSKRSRAAARDHLLSCAASTFEYQHRIKLFALYINDGHLRVMCLEHSGITLTEPLDYVKHPSLLPRLLWRFAHLTDAQKGSDMTATRLDETSEDYRLMNELAKDNVNLDIEYEEGASLPPSTPPIPDAPQPGLPGIAPQSTGSTSRAFQRPEDPRVFKHVRKAFRKSLCRSWPRYRLKVGEEGREFLVATPAVVSDTSLFGRGCRAYVAVDCSTRQFVWLKDSWRPRSECSMPEGAVLAAFAGDSKLHVPTLVCHGYVRQRCDEEPERTVLRTIQGRTVPDRTKTPSGGQDHAQVIGVKRSREEDFEDERLQPSPKKLSRRAPQSLPAYGHYRLAVKEVGLDLENFTSGWQLVRLIFDCIRTHSRAYKEYGLLHGDISPGNILIHPSLTWKDGKEVVVWHGMLIDWELAHCVRGNNPVKAGGDDVPIMSWEYASMHRVRNPRNPCSVEDELEAFFYVLLWYAVRFMRHTLPGRSVTPFIREFYDTFKRYPDGAVSCNDLRAQTIANARLQYHDFADISFCDDGGAPVHPLNGLLLEFLRRLQARYAVMQWEKRTRGVPGTTQHPQKLFDVTTAGRPVLRETQNVASRRMLAQTTRGVQAPSAKTCDLARSLQSHKGVVALFSEWVLKKNGWPLNDKVRDRLAKSYIYTRRFVDVPAVVSGEALALPGDMQRKRAKLVGYDESMSC